MAEGHAMMLTREWWLSVFLMGLGIHLMASHLKPRLNQVGGWLSRSWAIRNKARANARRKRIEGLRRSREAKIEATVEEFRLRISSLQWMFVAGLCLIILALLSPNFKQPTYEVVLWLVFAFVTSLLGITNILKGKAIRVEVMEADKHEVRPQVKRIEQVKGDEDEMELLLRRLFNENANANSTKIRGID